MIIKQIAVLTLCAAGLLQAVNLCAASLVNGGFEAHDGDQLKGWRAYGAYALDATRAKSGSASIFCETRGAKTRAGVMQEIVYEQPNQAPVLFGGWSKTESSVHAEDYCIYLDIWYEGGGNAWGVRANWSQLPHGWEGVAEVFYPRKPVKKIQYFVFIRNGGVGKVWFDDLYLERRAPEFGIKTMAFYPDFPRTLSGCHAEIKFWQEARWQCAALDAAGREIESFTGHSMVAGINLSGKGAPVALQIDATAGNEKISQRLALPEFRLPANPITTGVAVWSADSMQRVTPLTYPNAEQRAQTSIALELARNESESAQILLTASADGGHERVTVELTELTDESGSTLAGDLSWQRLGYILRCRPFNIHPEGVPLHETWLPDPLLPPAPFRLRPGATQGVWLTARASAAAKTGQYRGTAIIRAGGETLAEVPVTLRVRDFANPTTFGMPTAFAVMDGFMGAQYPEQFETMKRKAHDILLDHRLNPDDISRTTPPSISDLEHARERGMNRFNILNLVPKPAKPGKWSCYSALDIYTPEFDEEIKQRLTPYIAELRQRGLEKYAYLYGFDERGHEYYPAIKRLWQTLKSAFPEIPVLTTAYMYRDMANGQSYPDQEITDWFCPLTSAYDPKLSDELRTRGHQVWWYVCCGPTYPYANFASFEYPWIEGRLLGWMTHLYRSDGLLFWHVNYWPDRPALKTDDTFLGEWQADAGLRMPGDGQLLYPTEEGPVPCARLVNIRDGLEDYEWLAALSRKMGREKAEGAATLLIRSMTDFDRDPARLRAARSQIADMLEHR
ncbi:MAG: DUF4091 domain-containing protein [Kiritimatiellae bacterium]|nr:DUF4091 domain-containing protein [Kiritimatiellia bacterium]